MACLLPTAALHVLAGGWQWKVQLQLQQLHSRPFNCCAAGRGRRQRPVAVSGNSISSLCQFLLICVRVGFLGNSSWATHNNSFTFTFVHLFIHLSLIAKDEDYKTLVTFSAAACGDHLLFPYFPTFSGCISLIVLLVLIDVLACVLTGTYMHSLVLVVVQHLQMNRCFNCTEHLTISYILFNIPYIPNICYLKDVLLIACLYNKSIIGMN